MGMSEAEFFGQSIILWRRRISGFLEMHGAKEGAGADDFMSRAELEALMAQHPD